MKIVLDRWQEDVLNTTGNIVLRSGRQVGKSTVISIKAAEYAVSSPKRSIMIISATERQAYLLFSKVLLYIHDNHKKLIKTGKDRPTKSEIRLKNGSIIRCLPTGLDGLGIRGYTVDLLIADEAAFIPNEVWPAVTPMLATTGGNIILLSTPFGKVDRNGNPNYFYECFNNKAFKQFHVSRIDVANSRQEPQKTWMLDAIENERDTLTRLQFQQEVLGEFVDGLMQLFPDDLIKRNMSMEQTGASQKYKHFLGVDVARMGGDATTYEVVRKIDEDSYEHIDNMTETYTELPHTVDMIKSLHVKYHFQDKGIGIDTGGLGVGVFDFLRREPHYEDKIVDMNNAKRVYEVFETEKGRNEKKKTIMKEDMYVNLKVLLEHGKLRLLKDTSLFMSLKSVQFEYKDNGTMNIFGRDTHIAEGLIRAAWLACQCKSLNLWADYI